MPKARSYASPGWSDLSRNPGYAVRQDPKSPTGAALRNGPPLPPSIPDVPFIDFDAVPLADFAELVLERDAFVVFFLAGNVPLDLFDI